MNIQKMLDQMNNAVRIGLGPDAGQVKEWLHTIGTAMNNPVAEVIDTPYGPGMRGMHILNAESLPIGTKLFAFPPDAADEIQRLEAEIALLRTGDTCARQCEGTAYRHEAQRLKAENELHNSNVKQLVQIAATKDHQIERLQAHIDALMLEYCPDEMTPEQLRVWAENQVAVEEPKA